MTPASLHITAIAGSIRRNSYNHGLLRAVHELAPAHVSVDIAAIEGIPLYDPDADHLADGTKSPAAVTNLRDAVAGADAVMLATTEYNWGPSGVLKNVIDWLSRPAGASPLRDKPVALLGTSPGPAGTARAQLHVRQYLLATKSLVLVGPDVQLGSCAARFDDDLRLVDPVARQLLRAQLDALIAWTAMARGISAEPRLGAGEASAGSARRYSIE